ncbi:MAG: transcriptional repressor LexA [Patescibacteria group bacterium]
MRLTKKQNDILTYIREHLNEHGYAPSYREIADHFELSSPATVHQHVQNLIEKGYVQAGEDGSARSLEVVQASLSQRLLTKSVILPLMGLITAGNPIEAIEENEALAVPVDFVLDPANAYVLRVRGRSMIEDGIFDGDFVIVERNPSPKNGDVVVALLDNAYATLKRFYREDNQIRLQPANSMMQPIFVKGNINIQGVVRGVIRKFSTT